MLIPLSVSLLVVLLFFRYTLLSHEKGTIVIIGLINFHDKCTSAVIGVICFYENGTIDIIEIKMFIRIGQV